MDDGDPKFNSARPWFGEIGPAREINWAARNPQAEVQADTATELPVVGEQSSVIPVHFGDRGMPLTDAPGTRPQQQS